LRNSARNLLSAGFAFAAVLFGVRAVFAVWPGVADATGAGLAPALAAFGLAEAFGAVSALPAALADVLLSFDAPPVAVAHLLLSIDVLPVLADVLPFMDVAGVPVLEAELVPALAALFFLRHSLNAAPSLLLHAADEIEEAGGGVVAALVADGAFVDCAPTTPAANAVARNRARGLNRDWFITTSCLSEGYRSLNGPVTMLTGSGCGNRRMLDLGVRQFLQARRCWKDC